MTTNRAMQANPNRRPREPSYKGDLAVCTVCGKTWREAETDCRTPQDCNFIRETEP